MIYPHNFESKTGFDAVRATIASLCQSPQGREDAVNDMQFSTSPEVVLTELQRVWEMVGALNMETTPEIGSIYDTRPIAAKLAVQGMYADPGELLHIRRNLECAAALRTFFCQKNTEGGEHTVFIQLATLAMTLSPLPEVLRAINKLIDQRGEVKDNASPALAQIRSELAHAESRISSAMRRVVNRAMSAGLIDADTTPTVRDGRLVLPVHPMHKREIQGIVHDYSATGKTVFIEPSEVVELTNRRRELQQEERQEIVRLLIAMADTLRPFLEDISLTAQALGKFDFIAAKARYAIQTGGSMVKIDAKAQASAAWHKAVHPVLMLHLREQGRKVVPLDLKMGNEPGEGRIIVISGPNAGGKSVALKTVALVQYMMQCGVLPTMSSHSVMKVMEKIFIDIGDDQSIDNDLSTYSSHLRNMKFFLTHGNDRTLFLADEMGSGTEPQIGGALAQALLAEFNALGMWGVVTTHYQNLKTFADETPGLLNASMLYDRQKMQPLFALSLGHPGSSFAVEIARKTGLPANVIDKAAELVGSDYINLDKYLLDIARDKRYWENKRENIRQNNKQLQGRIEHYETLANELREQRRVILEQARKEAKEIVDQSNAAVEKTIRDIRNAQARREETLQARKQLAEKRRELENEHSDAKQPKALARAPKNKKQAQPQSLNPKQTQDIEAGSNVLLDNQGTPGTVISIDGKKATVAFGDLKMSVPVARISPTLRKPVKRPADRAVAMGGALDTSHNRRLDFKTEIDLRGFRADEALQAVMHFIDDAVQFSIARVRILHGTGTGALRQAIRQYLDTIPMVKSFHDEDVRFGGAGITVVNL